MFGRLRALLARLAGDSSSSSRAQSARSLADQPRASPGSVVEQVMPPLEGVEPDSPTSTPEAEPGDDRLIAIGLADLAQAQDLLAAGKLPRAIALLEDSLHRHPDAEVATALNELKTIRRARKRLQRHPADPQAHFELGRALFAQERGDEALGHLEVVCQARPNWLEPHLLRAYEWHWRGQWREAEAAYLAALAIDPAHPVARRGLTAVRLGQSPDALMSAHDPATGSGAGFATW